MPDAPQQQPQPFRINFTSWLVVVLISSASLVMGFLFLFMHSVVDRFETRELYSRSAQFNVFLERELENLAALAESYAEWQEAYDFFVHHDSSVLEALYSDNWLHKQRIDYVAKFDRAGQRLWTSLDRNLPNATSAPLSGKLPAFGDPTQSGADKAVDPRQALGSLGQATIDPNDRRFFPPGLDKLAYEPLRGYLLGGAQLYIYAAWPVTDNLRTLAPDGLLVFARRLDSSRISSYLASPHIQAYFLQDPPDNLAGFPVDARVVHGELVHYLVVTDVLGHKLGAWSIALQRIMQRDALELFKYLLLSTCLVLLVCCLTLLLLFRQHCVRPVQVLCRQLDHFWVDPAADVAVTAQTEAPLDTLAGHITQLTSRIISQSDELARLAGNDALTGLPNRRKMENYVAAEVRRMLRRGYDMHNDFVNTRHAWLAFIMMDIDWFKPYNEVYGHPAGDICLRDFALVLQESIKRPSDLACRLGGDSFGMVLPETNEKGGLVTARRIRDLLADKRLPHQANPGLPFLTASYGVAAVLVDEHFNLELLMAMADRSLLAAKEQGRNHVTGMFAVDKSHAKRPGC